MNNLRNSELDKTANVNTSAQSEKSNSSFQKIEKNISEKYDEVALKHLKEQVIKGMRQELSLNKCEISDSSQVSDVLHNQIESPQTESESDNVPTQHNFGNL